MGRGLGMNFLDVDGLARGISLHTSHKSCYKSIAWHFYYIVDFIDYFRLVYKGMG